MLRARARRYGRARQKSAEYRRIPALMEIEYVGCRSSPQPRRRRPHLPLSVKTRRALTAGPRCSASALSNVGLG